MSEKRPVRLLFFFLFLLIASPLAAQRTALRWEGENLLVRLPDSVGYKVDLLETDSSALVVDLAGVSIDSLADGGLTATNGGMRGILTRRGESGLRLSLTADRRFGYALEWRPYTRTLVVRTFDWEKLEYGQEQYAKALLAFEQGMRPQGVELLRVAHAAGVREATEALGVYHARRGEHRRALRYLKHPVSTDAIAALAQVQRRLGDTTDAAANEATVRTRMAADSAADRRQEVASQAARDRADSAAAAPKEGGTPLSDWTRIDGDLGYWLLVGALALLLIGLLIWLARRNRKVRPTEETQRNIELERPHSPAVRPTPTVERTEQPTATEPVVEQARRPPAESADEPTAHQPVSTQAAEVRRRMEEARRGAHHAGDEAETAEKEESGSTLDEARRSHLSRDSVELRRRLETAGRRR